MDEPVPTPDVHGFEPAADTPFGGPYFVMDRVEGHAPNVWRRRDRQALEEDWDGERGLARDLADNLAGIHAIDADRAAGAATRAGLPADASTTGRGCTRRCGSSPTRSSTRPTHGFARASRSPSPRRSCTATTGSATA